MTKNQTAICANCEFYYKEKNFFINLYNDFPSPKCRHPNKYQLDYVSGKIEKPNCYFINTDGKCPLFIRARKPLQNTGPK